MSERVAVGGEGACMECVGCVQRGVHAAWGACGFVGRVQKGAGAALWPVVYMSDRIKGCPQAGGLCHVVATYEGQDLVSIEYWVGFYVVW